MFQHWTGKCSWRVQVFYVGRGNQVSSRAPFRGSAQRMGWSHLRVQPNLPEIGCVKSVCRLIQGTFFPPLPPHPAAAFSQLISPKAKGSTAQEYRSQRRKLPDEQTLGGGEITQDEEQGTAFLTERTTYAKESLDGYDIALRLRLTLLPFLSTSSFLSGNRPTDEQSRVMSVAS